METLRTRTLRDFQESWTLCQHCGACNGRGPIIPHNWRELPPPEWSSPHRRCPSFEHFNFRAYNAQGRGVLASLVFDDPDFPLTEDLLKIVYTCTSCGGCSDICKAVDPLTALWALRHELVRRGAELPERLRKTHERIRRYGNVFGATRSTAVEGLPTCGEDVFFAGCEVRFSQPRIVGAVAGVLELAGVEVACLGDAERCCGFIPGYDGTEALLEEQALRNVEALAKAGARRVIVSCAHCYRALKVDYPLIAGQLPFQVVHFSELLANLLREKKVAFSREVEGPVTYHDPCFLGRHGKVYDAPREVIAAVPGTRLVEMERNRRWSYCCGSGAKISSACYPEFGEAVTRERLAEGREAAGTVVTACTTCASTLSRGARREGLDVEVVDLSVFAARALGVEPDADAGIPELEK
ncbi:MAG: (Fe-S)-binding protein [Deltaproteobacteria bacterium]|nr:(Fe-S)-binding protein [Deltaproteobacteria bacterium]